MPGNDVLIVSIYEKDLHTGNTSTSHLPGSAARPKMTEASSASVTYYKYTPVK
jgi:hypothetical protein